MPKLEQSEKYKDIPAPVSTTRASVLESRDYAVYSAPMTITGPWVFESMTVGDVATDNYLSYNTTDGFEILTGDGAFVFDENGIRLLDTGASNSYIRWKESDIDTGNTIGGLYTNWDGGAGDDVYMHVIAQIPAGMTADDAVVVLEALDVASSSYGYLTVCSTGEVSIDTDYTPIGNTKMTVGLSINQGGADDEIINCRSSDVAHGATTLTDTDSFFTVTKAEGAAGGVNLRGYKDADGVAGVAAALQGFLAENVDTTKSTAGRGLVEISGFQTSGTGLANVVADGNVIAFRAYRGGAAETIAIIDEDGDLHLDGSNAGTFDTEDDALAVQSLAQGLAQRWNDTLYYNFDRLRELGVISGGDRAHPFVSTKNLNALMMGAIGQLYERLERAGL